MGKMVVTFPREHEHDPTPNANDWGAGSTWQCDCGATWTLRVTPMGNGMKARREWLRDGQDTPDGPSEKLVADAYPPTCP